MKRLILLLIICQLSCKNPSNPKNMNKDIALDYALVIHGGAGTILKTNLSEEVELKYINALNFALLTGEKVLKNGGTSLEAVQMTIRTMEDSPLFNAGKGAVFTNNGENELDASIMEGDKLNAGAIGGVHTIKNPIDAAIAVMNNSEHVMLTGKGAEDFAKSQGINLVEPSYFYTERRWQSLQKVKSKDIGSVEELKIISMEQ